MDAVILRVALLLCVPVSSVLPMQATDVLALAVASARQSRDESAARELGRVQLAALVNTAILAPDNLAKSEEAIRVRYDLPKPVQATVSAEAFFGALDGGGL